MKRCETCNVDLVKGIAIQTKGEQPDPNIRAEYTFHPRHEDLILDDCWKCPVCGKSETLL